MPGTIARATALIAVLGLGATAALAQSTIVPSVPPPPLVERPPVYQIPTPGMLFPEAKRDSPVEERRDAAPQGGCPYQPRKLDLIV